MRPAALSIVIPALNEEANLPLLLQDLGGLRGNGAEVIVVDGGSRDATVDCARRDADIVLSCRPGRALQMNSGARVAHGSRLLFLHADTRFSDDCAARMGELADEDDVWGFFRVSLRGDSVLLPVIAWSMCWRSRLSGIATGDQGLLVSRALFDAVAGFPEQPLMEDVEICKRLRALQPPVAFDCILESSGRRWDRDGALGTILLMWSLRLRYFCGTSSARLHERYYR